MDYKFTASMEDKLDKIAENEAQPVKILNAFWKPFSKTLSDADENMDKVVIDSGVKCPNCGRAMVVKTSRFGKQFLGCSGYPECKNTKPIVRSTGVKCPECGKEISDKSTVCIGCGYPINKE